MYFARACVYDSRGVTTIEAREAAASLLFVSVHVDLRDVKVHSHR